MGWTSTQVVVFANLLAPEGRIDELMEKFAPIVAQNRTEQGCITFDVHQSLDDPNLLLVHEIWERMEDLERHLHQPHVVAFVAAMSDEGFADQKPLFPSKRVF